MSLSAPSSWALLVLALVLVTVASADAAATYGEASEAGVSAEARKTCVCVTLNMLENMEKRIRDLEAGGGGGGGAKPAASAAPAAHSCTAAATSNTGIVRGVVQDSKTHTGIKGAKVVFGDCSVLTDDKGKYQITVKKGKQVKMEVSADKYLSTELYAEVAGGRSQDAHKTPLVPADGDKPGAVLGIVRNAMNKNPIGEVSGFALLRKGVNNRSGEVIKKVPVMRGFFKYAGPPGTYSVESSFETYYPAYMVLPLESGARESIKDGFVASPKNLEAKQVRVVLTWGKAPEDLDLHMLLPGNNEVAKNESNDHNRRKVMWETAGSKGAPDFAVLDVDDMDSFGPETITIHKVLKGTYHFYVHRFSEAGDIRTSSANIKVYTDKGLVHEMDVPVQGPATATFWDAFTFDGETQQISIVNRLREREPTPIK